LSVLLTWSAGLSILRNAGKPMGEDLTTERADKRADELIKQLRENVVRLKDQFDGLVELTDELEATVSPRKKGHSP